MNEAGKLKHRCHILLYRRGEAPDQDMLLEHIVTTKRQVNRGGHNGPLRRIVRRHFGQRRPSADYQLWLVDEPGWRKLGWAGRPSK